MLLEYIKNYWPFFLFAAWLGYKFWNTRRVKQLLPSLRNRNAVTIDVRTEREFQMGHFPSSLNIPLQEIKNRTGEIPHGVPIIVCCASGTRSGFARRFLKSNGYKEVYNIGPWTNL